MNYLMLKNCIFKSKQQYSDTECKLKKINLKTSLRKNIINF